MTFWRHRRRKILDDDQVKQIVIHFLGEQLRNEDGKRCHVATKVLRFKHLQGRQKLNEKLAYMHNNPVQAGLVKRGQSWCSLV